MFKISGREEFNKGRHINDMLTSFASAIDGLCFISHLFTIPCAPLPDTGGQVCVAVSEQANRLMMMKPCAFKCIVCVSSLCL